MPFGISQSQPDCVLGWATVKKEGDGYVTIGCHENKQDAIDQMVAASLDEDMEPLGQVDQRQMDGFWQVGEEEDEEESDDEEEEEDSEEEEEYLGLTDNQRMLYEMYEDVAETLGKFTQDSGGRGAHYMAESAFAEEGLVCSNCLFFQGGQRCEIVEGQIAPNGICKLWIIPEHLIAKAEGDMEESALEARQVDLRAPAFMRASARRGVNLYEEGFGGDGLRPATVADARKMAANESLSPAKWRRISPWIARHIVDLDAVEGDEITAGLVAMLLWGGGASRASARRAQAYAERIVAQLDAE